MSKIVTTVAIAGGVAAGAGLMYLLDPDRGHRRRKKARKQFERAAHQAAVQARHAADEIGERSRELSHLVNGGRRRRVLKLPRTRGGQVAIGTLAAAALAGGTAAARSLAYRH
jgi:hypothetical protein